MKQIFLGFAGGIVLGIALFAIGQYLDLRIAVTYSVRGNKECWTEWRTSGKLKVCVPIGEGWKISFP